jgi:hypothetical protein
VVQPVYAKFSNGASMAAGNAIGILLGDALILVQK